MAVVWPTGAAEGETPDADTGEKVALGVPEKLPRFDIFDTPLVYKTGGDVPRNYQVAQHLGCKWVELVVIHCHAAAP